MKKILLLFLLLGTYTFGQTGGKTGLSFLELGFGARNSAMADLGVVTASGASSAAYNPAILPFSEQPQVLFNHNTLLFDVSNQIIGANFNLFGLPFGAIVQTTSINDIEIRLNPGEPVAKFNAHYFMAGISSGIAITDKISAGLTVKYVYEELFTDNSNGVAFDLGVYYKNIIDGLNIGASFRHLGSMNDLKSEATPLPENLRLGASYSFAAPAIYSDFNLACGILKYSSSTNIHFQTAGEIVIKKFLSLRAGYVSGFDSKSITAGAGIKWGNFSFDYSIIPYKYDLGNSNIVSISFDF